MHRILSTIHVLDCWVQNAIYRIMTCQNPTKHGFTHVFCTTCHIDFYQQFRNKEKTILKKLQISGLRKPSIAINTKLELSFQKFGKGILVIFHCIWLISAQEIQVGLSPTKYGIWDKYSRWMVLISICPWDDSLVVIMKWLATSIVYYTCCYAHTHVWWRNNWYSHSL